MLVLLILLGLANLLWLRLFILGIVSLRKREYLDEAAEPVSTPLISIVVPARNESRILSQTMEALAALDYPNYEVLIIDDHSEDNTYQLAAKFAENHPNFRPMKAAELPEGWRGKSWALQQAVSFAQGNWMLFTDADIHLHPLALRKALAHAQKEKLDLLSVLPHLDCVTFWDRTILPSFAIILNIIKPLHESNNPESRIAIASGGFILIKSMVFRHLGGYESISEAIAEDVKLAELFKYSGYKIKTVLTRSPMVRTRMYENFRGLWEGLTRHAFEGSGYNPVKTTLAVCAGYFFMVAPAILFVLGLIQHNWKLVSFCAFPVITMIGNQIQVNRFWKIPAYYFLSFPIAVSIYGLMMLHSMISYYFHGGNLWKGRRYRKEGPCEST